MFFQIARLIPMLMLAALGAGCSNTPLDTVIAEDSGVSSDGSTPDAGSCFAPALGRFVLKSALNGSCLGSGEPTTVFGNPAFDTRFDVDCSAPAQAWDLSAVGSAGVFTFKNVGSADNLDVKMAATQNGTLVIVYAPTGLANQQFEARSRSGSSYELRPQHAPASCVGANTPGAQISICSANDTSQVWQFERSDCL
jgi:Ricin-type beta-trefoil lectin domain-like